MISQSRLVSDQNHLNRVNYNYASTFIEYSEGTEDELGVIKIPLSLENVLSMALIGTLALIGTVYIYVLYKRKRC